MAALARWVVPASAGCHCYSFTYINRNNANYRDVVFDIVGGGAFAIHARHAPRQLTLSKFDPFEFVEDSAQPTVLKPRRIPIYPR